MAAIRTVSRSGNDQFDGFAWNAMVDMCAMENLESFTPTQRVAHLAFWYMSEVNNGGHFQFFCNQEHLNFQEVVGALKAIGAQKCAETLDQAIARLHESELNLPNSLAEYVETEAEAAMHGLDKHYYESCDREFHACLEVYLAQHESEFIRWVE